MQARLTEQEHERGAMRKLQNVPLLSCSVVPADLTIPCYLVESIPRDDRVKSRKEKTQQTYARAPRGRHNVGEGWAHAAGIKTPITLRVNKEELSWVAPDRYAVKRIK